MILRGGRFNGESQKVTHSFKSGLDQRVIFFAYPSNRPQSGLTIQTTHDFAIQNIGEHGAVRFVPEVDRGIEGFEAYGFNTRFETEEEMYNLLNSQDNISEYVCPQQFRNNQNQNDSNFKVYPNPAEVTFKVKLTLDSSSVVSITLYSYYGEMVSSLVKMKHYEKGLHEFEVNTKNLNQHDDVQSDEFDFYHVILHELGHATFLEHINADKELMYYAAQLGFTKNNFRKTIVDNETLNGGVFLMNKSVNVVSPSCKMTRHSCYTQGIASFEKSDLVIYPNPTKKNLLIKGKIGVKDMKFEIYNMYGQEIKLDSKTFTDNRVLLSTTDLEPGSYIIRMFQKENQVLVKKFVKLYKWLRRKYT